MKMKNHTVIVFCFIIIISFNVKSVLADEFYETEKEPSIEILNDDECTVSTGQIPLIEAGAAIVMDAASGRVLYEKNGYSHRAMASTTKIMTAIIAIQNGNIDDNVSVSKRAAEIRGSTIGLRAGQTFKLGELLYGMMLNSGNDAAIAISEHIGGTVEHFLEMMNKKAEEIGARNTHFKSPHGLDMEGHYSTAYDLAVITRYALNNAVFSRIVRTKSMYLPPGSFFNTNEMLDIYPGADGVKTGYTGKAGRCLVTSATRGNWRIISVVLNCTTRFVRAQSTKKILDYAFNNYSPVTLIKSGEKIKNLPVIKGIDREVAVMTAEDIVLPLKPEELDMVETKIRLPESLAAPVYAGIEAGYVELFLNGEIIAQTQLKVSNDVRRKRFFDYMGEIIGEWVGMMR